MAQRGFGASVPKRLSPESRMVRKRNKYEPAVEMEGEKRGIFFRGKHIYRSRTP
jgi:hypothetical protein